MKKRVSFLLFVCAFLAATAQKPVIKVDLNQTVQSYYLHQVHQPGYESWIVKAGSADSAVFSGVKVVLRAKNPQNTSLTTDWSKKYLLFPYYALLSNDGVTTSNDKGGDIEMLISGLPRGRHSIQTFHNTWGKSEEKDFSPINVYLDGKQVQSKLACSNRVELNSEASSVYTVVDVANEQQVISLLFESDKTFKGKDGKISIQNVCIDGFEINTTDNNKKARKPVPANGEIHADADAGFLNLEWETARQGEVKEQVVYFSLDKEMLGSRASLLAKLPAGQNFYPVEYLYSMDTYFWRVDQVDQQGKITQGDVWTFRPRQLAFEGAEGYGRYATGGRGGKVVVVTNLNDDGPGSLREAVTNDIGPRTIVFNVSGIIELKSRLVLNQPFVTIAGQTAPGKGICIRSAPLGIGSEGICRFVRLRLGAGQTYDGMGMAGANNSIIDHCSISWTIDEGFSSRGGKNFSLQRTMIAEALNIAGHKNYGQGSGHGYAATIGGDIGTFHHNLLAHCNGRNWSLGGGLDPYGAYAGRMDIFNNVVYNWGTRATDGGAHQVNFVNNYYKKGPATSQDIILKAQLEGLGSGSQSYYYKGNVIENTDGTLACDGNDDSCGRTYQLYRNQQLDWEVFVDQPFFPSHAKIESASDAYKSVLSDVGCNMPLFDEHDQRIIRETLEGSFSYTGSKSNKPGIIDHQDDAGGYEDYPEEVRPEDFDSDYDGLPNWWEKMQGSNPASMPGDFSDANADEDRDGYTALEDYLKWMSLPRFYLDKKGNGSIDLQAFFVAYTDAPTFEIVDAGDLKIKIKDKLAQLKAPKGLKGITYIDVQVSDAQGSSMTRRFGICAGNE
ncbi:MAG: T9SS C-terminal target domain-containing protein [Bacteroidales bacterium]|nr:T9SS C-terminal target domain-containing protein [Bacteroidales bacterium]MDD3430520.1 T9SS C-terminal target domain-containing protein [Bacteroidales bacterium]MDD4360830.1 T9SS C-terminal target domain-containing protein [Bacteroidales bacterium]